MNVIKSKKWIKVVVILMVFLVLTIFPVQAAKKINMISDSFIPDKKNMEKETRSRSLQVMSLDESEKYYVVQFDYIPSEKERKRMKNDGILFLKYIPENAWIVSMTEKKSQELLDDEHVTYVGNYKGEYKKISRNIEKKIKSNSENEIVEIRGEFFFNMNEDDIENILETLCENYFLNDNFFTANIDESNIEEFSQQEGLFWYTDEVKKLQSNNDGSRVLIEVDEVFSAPYRLTGLGTTVAVWDGGWAGDHEDIETHSYIRDNATSGNLRCDWPGAANYCSFIDHATHVAGTMAGSGFINSQYMGVAPNSTILTYTWPDIRDPQMNELYYETNDAITNFHTVVSQNSWGYQIDSGSCYILGEYDYISAHYDNIVRGSSRLDGKISVVFSAGNERDETYCDSSTDLYKSVTGPGGTAKNTISIGAVTDSGAMTAFSSWGPANDTRIKPDLVAAGNLIRSTIMRNSPGPVSYPYDYSSGTSMSAPAVSGAISLLHEFYQRYNNDNNMTPEMVKVLLIQSAKDLGPLGPDFQNGYGLVNITEAIWYLEQNVNQSLFWNETLFVSGESDNYSIEVSGDTRDLKITLYWNDYPGTVSSSKHLINDLDLYIQNSTGHKFYPWTLNNTDYTLGAIQSHRDNVNNVEQVNITDPISGVYTLHINATALPYNQSYTIISNVNDNKPPRWNNNISYFVNNLTVYNLNLNISIFDGIGLSHYIFSWNDSGIWVNMTAVSLNSKLVNLNITQDITAPYGKRVDYKIYFNDTSGNFNETETWTFYSINEAPIINSFFVNSTDFFNRTNGTLTAKYDIDSPIGLALYNKTRWYKNSVEMEVFENFTILPFENISKNENWRINLLTTDLNKTVEKNFTISIQNGLPGIRSVANTVVREYEWMNVTLNITNDYDQDNFSVTINMTEFSPYEYNLTWNENEIIIFSWKTNLTNSGSYNVSVLFNDSDSYRRNSFLIVVNDTLDYDNDGVPNYVDEDIDGDGVNATVDYVFGNGSNINDNGSLDLVLLLNESSNSSRIINGTVFVSVQNDSESMLNFNWTFNSTNKFDFFNMTMKIDTTSIVSNLIFKSTNDDLLYKEFFIDKKISINYVCIKKTYGENISIVSSGCNGTDEVFVICDGSNNSNYYCVDNGTKYKVSGYDINMITEQCSDRDKDGYGIGCSLGADCNESSSLMYPGAACIRSCYTGSSYDSSCGCAGGTYTCSSSPSGGGGGGGGGSGPPSDPNFKSQKWINVRDGERTMRVNRKLIPIRNFTFSINVNKSEMTISILNLNKSANYPNFVGQLYKVIEINKTNFNNNEINYVDFYFRVNRTWLLENAVPYTDVQLFRHYNSWERLDTEYLYVEDDYYYYKSRSAGFSYFVIGYFPEIVTTTTTSTTTTTTIEELNTTLVNESKFVNITFIEEDNSTKKQVTIIMPKEKSNVNFFKVFFTLLYVGFFGYMIFFVIHRDETLQLKKHSIEKPHKKVLHIQNYIKACFKKGFGFDQIKKNLLKAGWSKHLINDQISHYKHKFKKHMKH